MLVDEDEQVVLYPDIPPGEDGQMTVVSDVDAMAIANAPQLVALLRRLHSMAAENSFKVELMLEVVAMLDKFPLEWS